MRRLCSRLGVVEQSPEHVVHPVEDAWHGPEVLRELATPVLQLLLDLVVQAEVGPPESVDGLLRVADEERPAGRDRHLGPRPGTGVGVVRRKQHGDLDLQRIGVLELVDKKNAEPFGEGGADTRGARQHVPRQHEQVVELDASLAAALLGVVAHEAAQAGEEHVERRLLLGGDHRCARVVGPFEQPAHVLDRASPVRVAADVLRQLRHLAQEVEAVEVVVRAAEDAGQRCESADVQEELVLQHPALREPGDRFLERGEDGLDVDGGRRAHGSRRRLEPLVVLVQHACDTAEVVEVDAERERRQQDRLELGIGDERIQELAPPFVEPNRGLDVVDDLEVGWQARRERMFGQDPLGEAVQGREGGVVDVVERDPAPLALLGGEPRVEGGPLEAVPDAVAQLAGGRFGERDGGELAHPDTAARDQRDDPVDERGGLARTGARLDEQRRVVEIADLVARRRIDRCHCSSCSFGGSASSRNRATTGSSRLRVQSSSRAGAHTRSYAQ